MDRSDRKLAPLAACLALAGMLALAVPLSLAAPADAAVRNFRFGVVTGTPEGAPDLNRIREARAKTVRFGLSWKEVEVQRSVGRGCSTAIYRWDRYDDFVRQAGQRGLRLLPFFIGSPPYAAPGRPHMPSVGSPAIEDYKCFVRAAVRRYGRGGIVSRSLGALPITEWQVWNEPNLPTFAPRGGIDPKEYGRFVKLTAAAARSVDKRASIVLAGMPAQPPTMSATAFLRKFYRVKRVRRAFDAVALHPYARNAKQVKKYVRRLRGFLKDVRDRRRPLWLTEVGWATRGTNRGLVTTERGQAKRLRKTFRMLRRHRDRFKLGSVHWFRWRDKASYAQNTGAWVSYAGLYRKNGIPKPACESFARFTGGRRPCRAIR